MLVTYYLFSWGLQVPVGSYSYRPYTNTCSAAATIHTLGTLHYRILVPYLSVLYYMILI